MSKLFFSLFSLIGLFGVKGYAQTGVSVSPPRLYFESDPGSTHTQMITVTNVSVNNSLDFAVSLGDWAYDDKGENVMYAAHTLPTSCASWISINPKDNYFTLAPGDRKEIAVSITAPNILNDTLSAHTAVLYVSQMNPIDDVDHKGSQIKVSIRSGIKLFHQLPSAKIKKLEIQNLVYGKSTHVLNLFFENQGNVWGDGQVYTDLINTQNGQKISIDPIIFYTMPGNKRSMEIPLPAGLEKGKYKASVILDYGDRSNLELGELSFTYE